MTDRGAAHLLYLKRPFQYDFIRDKYFAGRPMGVSLEHAVIERGQIRSRANLAEATEGSDGLEPSYARFHADSDGRVYVILAGTVIDGRSRSFANFIGRIHANEMTPKFQRINLKHPFHAFFTNTVRGGSMPSDTIDLLGTADDDPNLRYARLRLPAPQN